MLPQTIASSLACAGLLCALGNAQQPAVILEAHFDSDTDGFVYEDDAFLGTSQPNYADGARLTPGFGGIGGALQVSLAGVDNAAIFAMTGGWRVEFDVFDDCIDHVLSLRYRITESDYYEPTEMFQVLASVDSQLKGLGPGISYVGAFAGDGNPGGSDDRDPTPAPRVFGWKHVRIDLGAMDTGTHTLIVGGFNDHKNLQESVEILIDDVVIEEKPPSPFCDVDPQVVLDGIEFQRFKDNIETLSDFGNRVQGSASYQNAEAWIAQQLHLAGYTPQFHDYRFPRFDGAPRRSIYATKVGSIHPDRMYIISAHLDGVAQTSGAANDNASGCSLVLEAARAFAQPGVETECSIRFVFWNNEETGLNGSEVYAFDRSAIQGMEDPPGSGLYPEPCWLGLIQHDQILWDHGLPSQANQVPEADLDIEFQDSSDNREASKWLAEALLAGNQTYSVKYPAEIGENMNNTDSKSFQNYCPAVSIRDNRRVSEIGNGANPTWHQLTDFFGFYSEDDFRMGFDAVRMTVGTVAELAGAFTPVAAYSTFGTGCPGSAGVPALHVVGSNTLPVLNNTLMLQVDNVPVGAPVAMLIGFSNQCWDGSELPLALDVIGMAGCDLLVSPLVVAPAVNNGGTASWSLLIPNDASLLCLRFFNQAIVRDPGVNFAGYTASNGGEGVIGRW
jgi:hypothetical protein